MKYIKRVTCELYAAAIAYRVTSEGKREYLLAKRFKDEKAHLVRGRLEAHDESLDARMFKELKKEVKVEGLIMPGLEYMIKKRIDEETKKAIIYAVVETQGEKPKPDKEEIQKAWWATLEDAVLQLGNRYEVEILRDVDPRIRARLKLFNRV